MEVQQYLQRLLSIHSVAATRPRIFLYVKGGPEFFARARELSFAHEIHEVPNIGREQETYLRHVVAHYDRLPQHVLFSQASPLSPKLSLSHSELAILEDLWTVALGLCWQHTIEAQGNLR